MACPWENFSVGICVRGEGFKARLTLINFLVSPSSGICESSLPGS